MQLIYGGGANISSGQASTRMGQYLTNLGLNTLQVIQGSLTMFLYTISDPPPSSGVNLTLTANDVVLPQLTYVFKNVSIGPFPGGDPPLPSFASVSLQALVSIGESLNIVRQQFTNFTSFSGLKCVGGVIIVEQANAALTSFAGLESLTYLGHQGTTTPLLIVAGDSQDPPFC